MGDPNWQSLIPVWKDAVLLLANLIGGRLLDCLLSRNLLTYEQYEDLDSQRGEKAKDDVARALLRILRRSPHPSFDNFWTVLATEVDGGSDVRRHLWQLLEGRDTPLRPNSEGFGTDAEISGGSDRSFTTLSSSSQTATAVVREPRRLPHYPNRRFSPPGTSRTNLSVNQQGFDSLSIKPKRCAKEESESWKEQCTDAARDFLDDYKILKVSVGQKFWKTITDFIADEKHKSDGVSIHKEVKSFVVFVVGKDAAVSSCVRSLKSELKRAEIVQEKESIVTKYVKASNAENLHAFLDSHEYAAFCIRWPEVNFRAVDSRCAIEIECQQKIAERVRESLETVVSGFQTEYLPVSQHLHTFFLRRGFEKVNALLLSQGIQVKIIAVDKREHRLKAAGNPAEFSKARNVLLTSYQAVQINVDDVETQEFLSTVYFASFVDAFAGKDVILIPSLADMARAMVTGGGAFVVGSAMDAAFVAKQVNEYLKQNVIYSITLDFPTATGRFLQEYKWNALMEIKNQLKAFSAEIKAVPGPRYTLELSANRDGLQPLRREIDKAARTIKSLTAEVQKYGLYRFLGSESYVKEKCHLEGKYRVIIATDQDKEDSERDGSKVKQHFCSNVVGSVSGSASKKDTLQYPDTVVITVLGEKCHDAFRALKEEIDSECVREIVDVAVPEILDEEKLMQLQTLVLEKHVVMTFKAGAADASPHITFSGWKKDTRNAMKVVVKALSEHWKTDKEAHVAELQVVAATNLKARVSWYWLSDTGYREYSPQVAIQIEDALVRQEKTVITVGQSKFEIDAAGRKQISMNSGNVRKIKREDVSDGILRYSLRFGGLSLDYIYRNCFSIHLG